MKNGTLELELLTKPGNNKWKDFGAKKSWKADKGHHGTDGFEVIVGAKKSTSCPNGTYVVGNTVVITYSDGVTVTLTSQVGQKTSVITSQPFDTVANHKERLAYESPVKGFIQYIVVDATFRCTFNNETELGAITIQDVPDPPIPPTASKP